jgi:hypothetical protein
MVEWLKAGENHVMVTFSEDERRRILSQFFPDDEDRAKYVNRILSFHNSVTQLQGRSQKVIGFDNLDIIMRSIVSPNQLGPSTITDTEL